MADSEAESIITSRRKLQEMTLPANEGHDVPSASGVSMKQYEEQLSVLSKENFHLKLRISFLEEKFGTGAPPAVQGLLEHNVRLQVELEKLRRQLTDKKELLAATAETIDVLENQGSISTATRKEADKPLTTHNKDKELTYTHVSDSELKKYEEILKCKDEHIKDLENKVRQLQTHVDNTNEDSTGCVLGEEKKKLAESILEQNLALAVGLELDESMAAEELTIDESNLDISQSMRIDDLTIMFGHHLMCSDDSDIYSMRTPIRNIPQVDVISESEPDRNASLARVGRCDTGVLVPECVSENKYRSRHSKLSHGSRSEESKPVNENILREQVDVISKRIHILEEEKKDLRKKLELAAKKLDDLTIENNEMKATLALEQQNVIETNKNLESLKQTVFALDTTIKDNEQQISHNLQLVERLRSEKHEMESTFLETERSLRGAADKAAVQASQAALELARSQYNRLLIEKELEVTRENLTNTMIENSRLEIEIKRKVAMQDYNDNIDEIYEGVPFEAERPTSDQGIDSDRLSSLEQNDEVNLSPRSLKN